MYPHAFCIFVVFLKLWSSAKIKRKTFTRVIVPMSHHQLKIFYLKNDLKQTFDSTAMKVVLVAGGYSGRAAWDKRISGLTGGNYNLKLILESNFYRSLPLYEDLWLYELRKKWQLSKLVSVTIKSLLRHRISTSTWNLRPHNFYRIYAHLLQTNKYEIN